MAICYTILFLRIFGRILFAPENEGGGADEGDEPEAADEPEAGDESAEGADEGDEPEEGDEPDEGDDADDEPAPSRKENRVSKLAKEAREERDRRISLETENRLLRENGTASRVNNDEAKRVREEKLSLMEPAERREFLKDEELAELRRGQQMTQIQLADMTDRSAYDTRALGNPVYAKHKEWVENTLRAERAAGRNPSREVLLRIKIGDEALKPRSKKQTAAEKTAAAERVRKAKGKTLSARGDAGGSSKNDDSAEALRQRILAREARGDM